MSTVSATVQRADRMDRGADGQASAARSSSLNVAAEHRCRKEGSAS
jgi:hypothetical protein